jgi:hypothetical protein
MSQSDYIKYKKTSTELKRNKLPDLLEYANYNSYKGYSLENTTQNAKITYNQLIPPNKTIIWNMEKTVTANCPKFAICNNTTSRPNKKIYPTNYNANYCNVNPSRPLSMKKINLLTTNTICKCLPI